MEPLQRKNVLCKILSLILTQRVLTLQEMRRYFIVYEYLTTTQKKRRHLLYLSRMVHCNVVFGREIATGFGHGLVHKIG